MSNNEQNTERAENTELQAEAVDSSGKPAKDNAAAAGGKQSPQPTRRGPAETLDRASLLRRYRLMRNLAVLFALTTLLLGGVALGQNLQSAKQGQEQAAADAAGASNAAAETANCSIKPRNNSADYMAIGKKSAPVVLAEFLDFRCPYCGVFARETFPTLVSEYVKTGKVRIEVHDVSMIDGEHSTRAAVAARAAGKQGKYFEYAHAVYAAMEHGRPELTDDVLVQYAKEAGVKNIEQFKKDLADSRLATAVQESTTKASGFGVQSVPTFVNTANCQALQGAQPLEQFKQFLDSAVAQASQN